MTSLLQEELAQLEDYFLSEPLPEKGPRLGKCDRGPLPAGPQPFCQLPYASYSTSNQSESSPLLVTLATGELDLLSVCGGPIGRSKIPRHAPYSCSRPSGCVRKRVPDGARFTEGGKRKQKKRDQNKTAAHRYRQRKRAELDTLEEQLHGLEGKNRELRDKAESVEREIQYVKDLLIEVYKARSQRLKQD
uniref:Activating transcription factor 5a n=1 Tax=Gasterosteus aculeatus TaxID=69293 RepID=G3QAS4_GASAC